ncbi:MAG: hypothetical protein WAU45_13025 [Blastocatellia bacterium]
MNDRGVDVLLTADGFKAGFQIKSHFDVAAQTFSADVKRQFAEALSHGLDHYYILICSPLVDGNSDYRQKINHLLNEIGLFRQIRFDTFNPQNTLTIFKQPPMVTREELLIRKAIPDDCLNEHEKGYEHLPEVHDENVRIAQEQLESFGDDLFDTEAGWKAFVTLERLVEQRQADQFLNKFVPTLPPEVKEQRASLVSEIAVVLSRCRACNTWDDRSEEKLPSWLDHVPESMIPYTSIPNLLRIRNSVEELHARHKNVEHATDATS